MLSKQCQLRGQKPISTDQLCQTTPTFASLIIVHRPATLVCKIIYVIPQFVGPYTRRKVLSLSVVTHSISRDIIISGKNCRLESASSPRSNFNLMLSLSYSFRARQKADVRPQITTAKQYKVPNGEPVKLQLNVHV